MREKAAALIVVAEIHTLRLRRADGGEPVVLRQAIVGERERRREQLIGGQPVEGDLAEKELRLGLHGGAQAGIELGEQRRVRRDLVDLANEEPLPREVVDERLRLRVG